ncbi:MAG: MarR family transcriptional regulator [Thermodesulfobacteriota bacterium]|nr:MarR family transcriptional regulator [Thermodesulfobacteriota bacterium]
METQDCIFFQLSRAGRSGARYWHKKVAKFGLTSAQALVLLFLLEEDQVTSKYLGEKIEFDSATLTGLIDRLAKIGLLERRNNPNDRRAILVCLTQQGHKTVNQIKNIVENENKAFLSNLTKEEGLILRSLLKKIC